MTACTGFIRAKKQGWEVRLAQGPLAQGPRPKSERPEYLDFSQEQMEEVAVQVLEELFCLF